MQADAASVEYGYVKHPAVDRAPRALVQPTTSGTGCPRAAVYVVATLPNIKTDAAFTASRVRAQFVANLQAAAGRGEPWRCC